MDEKSPLLASTNIDSNSVNESSGLPRFITEPRLINKRFKYAIPSQESEKDQKDRFFSIKICYVVMFCTAVSFTITISSMWPFLQIIDTTTDTAFFGWIVSAFSVGQLIASPLFGFWANRISCHKIPIIVCLLVTVVGNIIYMYLESVEHFKAGSPKMWMLASRFIQGAGAAAAAVIRSYVSSATNVEERTSVLANISACQGLGFIIGPVLQAALVPVGYPGLIRSPFFHLNFYTSPALLSMAVYILISILMIYKFTEYVVLDNKNINLNDIYESNAISINHENSLSESIRNLPPPDYIAVGLALGLFFINCFVFSFYETLSSPLTIDMYAWTKKEATFYNGLILGGLGIFAVVVVLLSKFLAKVTKEKTLMLWGYIVLFISVAALLPWGNEYPSVQIPTIAPGEKNTTTLEPFNTTMHSTTTTTFDPRTTDDPRRGCPLDYEWCLYTPIIKLYQFLIGFVLLVSGYSVANVMSFAIYSKLLGPKPQGTMMGLLTSIGSLSRAVGPVVVSYLYGSYGPRVSFITLDIIILVAIIIILATFKRYEPYKFS